MLIDSLTNGAGKLDLHMFKYETRSIPDTLQKNQLKMNQGSKFRPNAITFQEVHIRETLQDIGIARYFLEVSLEAQAIKVKIDK